MFKIGSSIISLSRAFVGGANLATLRYAVDAGHTDIVDDFRDGGPKSVVGVNKL